MRTPLPSLVLATLLAMPLVPAQALTAAVTVKAGITEQVAEVGSPLQFQVTVSGGESDEGPPEIKVDGLDIQYAGPSSNQRFSIVNGRMTSEVETTYVYQVTPEREGDFTFPPVTLKIDGRAYKTQPVGLKVQKGANSSNQVGFAEISVGKKSAYVGELVPVSVKLYVRSDLRKQISDRAPEVGGDGFTVQPMQRPTEDIEERDGISYSVISFRTVITPSKAGRLTIGPSEIPFVAQIPRTTRNRPRSQIERLFGDDFFDPFGSRMENRRFDAKAPAVELEVKPVPAEGRPKSFSGAVGQFTFESDASPTRLKVGDPVTMKLKISGAGNFDRITAPTMVDSTGWQSYDSSENFEPRDELKTSGTKTFELPVVPETVQKETPTFAFSYFDPKLAKYVTLRSKPKSLLVEGNPAAAPQARTEPAKPSNPDPAASPSSQSPVAPTPVDLAGLRYEPGVVGVFAPVYRTRNFWALQAVPAAAAFVLVLARVARRDPRKRRASALERQRNELWHRLRSQRDAEFWENASRLVQFETARKTGAEVESVDATSAKNSCPLEPDVAAAIEEVFERRDALLFAGAGSTRPGVTEAEQTRVIQALEKFCRR